MENTIKNTNETKGVNAPVVKEIDLEKEGYIRVPLILGDTSSKYGTTKFLKIRLVNNKGNEIISLQTLHENNDKERGRISFFNYYVNNIFKKINPNDSLTLTALAKFGYRLDNYGHNSFYVKFSIHKRSIMFFFNTDENMILSDALESKDENVKFFMENIIKENGITKVVNIPIKWEFKELETEELEQINLA